MTMSADAFDLLPLRLRLDMLIEHMKELPKSHALTVLIECRNEFKRIREGEKK